MTIGLHALCVLVALVMFALAFFNVPKPAVSWVAGGYFFTLLAFTFAA
jgi:hypothetical protein